MTHCGHRCCETPADPLHDHFLIAAQCPHCTAQETPWVGYANGRRPEVGDDVVGTCWPIGTVTATEDRLGKTYVQIEGLGWCRADVLLVLGDS